MCAPRMSSRAALRKGSTVSQNMGRTAANSRYKCRLSPFADSFLTTRRLCPSEGCNAINPSSLRASSYIRMTYSSATVSHFSGVVYPLSCGACNNYFSHGKTRHSGVVPVNEFASHSREEVFSQITVATNMNPGANIARVCEPAVNTKTVKNIRP